jgi:hypothetical protein
MSRNGFSLVELLLAMTLAVFAMAVLAGAILYTNDALSTGALHVQADWRAQECLHVVHWIRDAQGWEALASGTYGLASTSGQWEFTDEPGISGRFIRSVVIGSEEDAVREVTCAVAWSGSYGQRSVTYHTILGTWPTE